MRLDDPRLTSLAADTGGLSAVVSFVEESADHRLFIAAALLEDGEIRHVHRKLFLPTYGLFDERRFFAAGRPAAGGAVAARASGIGLAVCEDFWHLAGAAAARARRRADPDQRVVVAGPRPGARRTRSGLGTATSWRTLMRTYAQLTTSFVVFCNRVGVDESISFWGGSEVIAPTGAGRLQRAALRRGAVHRRHRPRPTSAASGSRCRCCATSGPSCSVRELRRIVAERAGLAARLDRRARRRAGSRRRAERRPADRRPIDATSRRAPSGTTARPAMTGADAPFELPDRARDRHRRRAAGHRRVHPRPARARPASSGRCSACRAASTRRSWRTSSPRRSAPSGCCAC